MSNTNEQYDTPAAVESELSEATRQDTTPPATFVRASNMPRDSAERDPRSVEARIENAIEQLGVAAERTDNQWTVEALATLLAELERLWALEAGFEYVDGDAE